MVDLIELGSKYNWPWRRGKSRTKTANRYKTRRAVITCVFNWEKNGGINTCMEGSDKWNAHAIIYIKDGPSHVLNTMCFQFESAAVEAFFWGT